jgi:hypothetical protein
MVNKSVTCLSDEHIQEAIMLADFEDIAEEIGLTIPAALAQLIELGAQPFKRGVPTLFASLHDIELIDCGDVERLLGDWLGRDKQRGAGFTLLPFAMSCGVDAYCYVLFEEGDEGIARVKHDEETSELEYPSISHWIASEYIRAFTNLAEIGCFGADGGERLQSELGLLERILLPEHLELLLGLLSADVVVRPFRAGPRSALLEVPSLLGQDQAETLIQSLAFENPLEFDVLPEWED